uniref:Uncharacterized protein n=1 Tax=Leersia perrieri TaxID=77586 RepID=A0A0D9VH95_9ORYZ
MAARRALGSAPQWRRRGNPSARSPSPLASYHLYRSPCTSRRAAPEAKTATPHSRRRVSDTEGSRCRVLPSPPPPPNNSSRSVAGATRRRRLLGRR